MVFDSHHAFDAGRDFDVRRGLRQRGPDPEDMLTREETATALTAAGYRIKLGTLATKASRGGGPPYQMFNCRALYRWADAIAWARGQMKAPQPDGDAAT